MKQRMPDDAFKLVEQVIFIGGAEKHRSQTAMTKIGAECEEQNRCNGRDNAQFRIALVNWRQTKGASERYLRILLCFYASFHYVSKIAHTGRDIRDERL
jgi:hypothetical protein